MQPKIKNRKGCSTMNITALNSGLRQGELLAFTWNDINFDRQLTRTLNMWLTSLLSGVNIQR
jgi:integrase